jgi:hypothetical protein
MLVLMAALKPIISTPIRDVKDIYKKEVKIATTAEEMPQTITAYLSEAVQQLAASQDTALEYYKGSSSYRISV